jgi:hypothetical protein
LRLTQRRRARRVARQPVGNREFAAATKVAVSPEIAVKFGSAKVRMTLARSIARIVAMISLTMSRISLAAYPEK